ncbi:MAG: chloride channel protein [Bacillota bacterium]
MRIRRRTAVYKTGTSLGHILKWTGIAVLVGVITGMAAVLFTGILNWGIDALSPLAQNRWVYVLPALGLMLSGLMTSVFAPEAAGHGTDAAIRAYNRRWGYMSLLTVPVKLVASVFTIASGGSAGREGPTVQMGAALGYWVGRTLNLSLTEIRKVVMCAMGASFGSIFAAPLAGGVFGAEVLYRDDMEYNNLYESFVASVSAYFVYSVVLGRERLFAFSSPGEFVFTPERDVPYFLLFGIGVGAVSLLYVKTLYGVENLAQKLPVAPPVRTSIGGLLTGMTALLATPYVLGPGISLVERVMTETVPWRILLLLLLGKIAATAFTVGSGASGGVVAPSLALGALAGALMALAAGHPFPETVIAASSIGLLGAAGHIPITGVVMAVEIMGVGLMKPVTMVCLVGAGISRGDTLFREAHISRAEKAGASHYFGQRPL